MCLKCNDQSELGEVDLALSASLVAASLAPGLSRQPKEAPIATRQRAMEAAARLREGEAAEGIFGREELGLGAGSSTCPRQFFC